MRSWDRLAAFLVRAATVTEDGGEPERIDVSFATWNLFTTLGAEPLLGRTFTAEEDQEGSDRVAVLSHAFWVSRYGADPGVVGRTVLLDDILRTVVGVMPAEFRFPTPDVRFWLPLALSAEDLQSRGNHSFSIVGRLQPGITLVLGRAELRQSLL